MVSTQSSNEAGFERMSSINEHMISYHNEKTRTLQSRFTMVMELSGVQFGVKPNAGFEITSMILEQNRTTWSSVTTL